MHRSIPRPSADQRPTATALVWAAALGLALIRPGHGLPAPDAASARPTAEDSAATPVLDGGDHPILLKRMVVTATPLPAAAPG